MFSLHQAFAKSCVFLLLLSLTRVYPQDLPVIAVLDFDALGISEQEAQVLTNRVRANLVRTGAYTVIDRGQMQGILEEQDFQQTGCVSDECAVEVGALLGASLMLAGSIGRFGSLWTIEMRIMDVATSRITKSASYDVQGAIELVLTEGIPEAVRILTAGAAITPSPPPARALATLEIRSEPIGATVIINDLEVGTTPFTQSSLRPDQPYAVSVYLAGYQPVDTTLIAEAGRLHELDFAFTPLSAYLSASSSPSGARVVLDTVEIGTTPLSQFELEPNQQYTVSLSLAGYQEVDTTLIAQAGGLHELDFAFTPLSAYLTATSSPSGAQMALDAVEIGTTPISRFEVTPNRQHVVSLALPGYEQKDTTYFAAAGSHTMMNLSLETMKGLLTIQTVPSGATVVLDGQPVGTSPLARYAVAGNRSHTVSLQLAGYQTVDTTLFAEPGGVQRLAIRLRRPAPTVAAAPAPAPAQPPAPTPTPQPEPVRQPEVAPKRSGGRWLLAAAAGAAIWYYGFGPGEKKPKSEPFPEPPGRPTP